jgi:hypothetical protein
LQGYEQGGEMKIVKPDAELYHELVTHGQMNDYYHDGFKASDTIEITDAEWEDMYAKYDDYQNKLQCWNLANKANSIAKPIHPFSQYLRKLIELKEIK